MVSHALSDGRDNPTEPGAVESAHRGWFHVPSDGRDGHSDESSDWVSHREADERHSCSFGRHHLSNQLSDCHGLYLPAHRGIGLADSAAFRHSLSLSHRFGRDSGTFGVDDVSV